MPEAKSESSETAGRKRRPADDGVGDYAIRLFQQLILAAVSSVGLWTILDLESSERHLVALAALAGLVGGSVGPLLRPAQPFAPNTKGARALLLSPLVYGLAGAGLGIAFYVLVRALLFLGGPSQISPIGTVALGVIVGLATVAVIARSWEQKLGGEVGSSGTAPAVVEALSQLDERLFGRTLQNYDGYLEATWHAAERGSSTRGRIRVQLRPRVGPDDEADRLPTAIRMPGEGETPKPSAGASGRVLVQGGRDAAEAVFTVSVIHAQLDVYPLRMRMMAPVGRPSEPVEFVLRGGGENVGSPVAHAVAPQSKDVGPEPEAVGSMLLGKHPESSGSDEPQSALIELAQEGQTVQLVELSTPAAVPMQVVATGPPPAGPPIWASPERPA